ncbi:CDP-glycerol glycerophosphotransferase family protein [Ruania alba]|uniref:CDP-glycerol glycerophosphotransferase, TagB/SpsB family n=1 Tax=Ruania alba TaxID=648782 RepID=A0A1H5NAD3_9MICO|nr:CDP-glycerol glycerophosphotransferase family protein [Ruania alba]SEE98609.1 CDP-glycerol glycerophosphotransferase, TagB/SpsB family [Ruania alba]
MRLRPVCEFIDHSAGRLLVHVHLRGSDESPESSFRLRLRSRTGYVAATVEAPVAERVNTVGRRSFAALAFAVPIERVPDGGFRLEVARTGSTTWVPVGTSPGLLASSRLMTVGARRMQVFPAAGRSATWVRFSSWTRWARVVWAFRNVLRDLAFILYLRRFWWVRPVRALTRPFVPRGEIWLIGERAETARDNGRALFAYLRQNRPAAPIYYTIDKDSPMVGAVASLGHVVWRSSLRHRILMLHASVLANAYSIKHMLPSRWRPGAYMNQCAWRVGAKRVYLKHGVHLSPDALKRANGGYDLLLSVGPAETAAMSATSGYRGRHLRETGLARYDNLRPERPSRTVLFMPTWRRYLVPTLFGSASDAQVAYPGSTYQEFVDGFLGDPRLAHVLQAYDLRLAVVPHYNLASLLRPEQLASQRIEILDGASADIPGLLRSSAMLLTDYSSVQFDVAYVGAPVVYAQFDREEYAAGHGGTGWFDTVRDGFGPQVTTVLGAIEAIERYAVADFEREEKYAERVARIFAYQDRENCARIAAAIDAID